MKKILTEEEEILRKFKVKSQARSKYEKRYYVNKIKMLSEVLHMTDEDIMRYLHKGIMLKGPVTYDCDVRKKLLGKYNLIARHIENKYYGEDFGYEDNEYCLYENDKHLLLYHMNYMTGSGTDFWITLIR